MSFIRIVSLVVTLVCATCVLSQTYNVSTVGCSVTKTCRFFPTGCTVGASDCRVITWKKAAASASTTGPLIEIEMRSSPGAGYIAIGFGRYNIMQDADVYYCTSANTFNTAAIVSQHAPPASEPLENGVVRTASSQIDKAINCRFQRTMAVSKPSTTGEYSYDLLKEGFHLLVAEGQTDANNDHAMKYHTSRSVTADKINFTANFPVDAPTTTPATTTAAASATKDPLKQTMAQQTTMKGTPAASNQAPTTSPATPPEQTTSSASAIQSSYGMTCAIILVNTILMSGWKC